MDKLKQELKESKRYEYDVEPPGGLADCSFEDFRSHKNELSLLFVKTKVAGVNQPVERIQVIFYARAVPEGYVALEIYNELPLEELEKVIDIFLKSNR